VLTKKIIKFTAIAALTLNLSTSSVFAVRVNVNPEEEKALMAQRQEYAKQYAAGNASKMAEMWTEDGTFVDAFGQELKGRQQIEDFFNWGFKKFGPQQLEVLVDSTRFISPDVAILEGTSRRIRGSAAASPTHYSATFVKQDGKWQIAALHEEGGAPSSPNLHDLDWMIGNWSAKNAKEKLQLKVTWTGDHSFILCLHNSGNSTTPKDVQLIGWDPISQSIRSWHFAANGGFGTAKWLKSGDCWVEKAEGTTPDGATCGGINIIRKVNDDSFCWSSTGRTFAGKDLPDIGEVTVVREQSEGKEGQVANDK